MVSLKEFYLDGLSIPDRSRATKERFGSQLREFIA